MDDHFNPSSESLVQVCRDAAVFRHTPTDRQSNQGFPAGPSSSKGGRRRIHLVVTASRANYSPPWWSDRAQPFAIGNSRRVPASIYAQTFAGQSTAPQSCVQL